MKTQLIILKQGNIIVSDEEIKEGDWVIVLKKSQYLCFKANVVGTNIYNNTYGYFGRFETKKLISSDNSEFNLPSIDYSHPIEKYGVIKTVGEWLGIFDVEKLAKNFSKIHHGEYDNNCTEESAYQGYIEGFKKSQSLNDKKFSLEDMERAIQWAHDKSTEGVYLSRLPVKEFIKSLQQPKVFDIEVEMECCGRVYSQFCDVTCEYIKPKIINNSIKIVKLS